MPNRARLQVGAGTAAGRPPGRARGAVLVLLAVLTAGCGSTVAQTGATSGQAGPDAAAAPELGGAMPAGPEGEALAAEADGSTAVELGGVGVGPAVFGPEGSASQGPDAALPAGGAGPQQRPPGAATPGVTAKSVLIGIDIRLGNDERARALNIQAASIGNMRAQMQALVDDLNRRGGLLGRRVQAVYGEYEGATNSQVETEEQAACAKYTQDNRVFAVISPFNGGKRLLRECLEKAGVPIVTYAPVDERNQQRLSGYFAPGTVQIDRAAKTVVSGLADQGFLGKDSRVGVLYADFDTYPDVLKRSMLPALSRLGVASVTTAAISLEDPSTASRDASAAVLAFNSARVDRVIPLGAGGLPLGLFMVQAEGQGYRPDYGLSSYDSAEAVRQNVPAAQFEGMQGVGWQSDDSTTPPPVSPAQRRCIDVMGRAGQTGEGSQRTVFYQDCDLMWYFEAVAVRAGSRLTAESFTSAAAVLGRSFQSTLAYRLDFSSGRRDGVAATRAFKYDNGCSCIVAFGPVKALP